MTDKKEEGVIYVSATGPYYSAPEITSEDIVDALHNNYVKEQLSKASSKIFNGMYSLSIKDADGDELEDLIDRVKSMMEAPKVMMWSRMKQTWYDIRGWGCCPVFPIWRRAGAETVLEELRRLPPESFDTAPSSQLDATYSDLLPGFVLNDAGELEAWQVQSATDLTPVKLKPGIILFKDPASTSLTGDSLIADLVPVVRMLEFCWEAQMQKINRVGSPIFLIRINGVRMADDVEYAQKILQNWGKSTAFQLRENMEVIEIDLTDNEAALNTIAKLEDRIEAPFRPSSSLDKEGLAFSANAAAQKEAEDDWVAGERSIIENCFESLLQTYLEINGYTGCSVELRVAVKKAVPGDLELKQAQLGIQSRVLSPNEVRSRLGAEELSDEELAQLADQWSMIKSSAMAPGDVTDPAFGDIPLDEVQKRADVLASVTGIDPMDPERIMSKDEQLAFLKRK